MPNRQINLTVENSPVNDLNTLTIESNINDKSMDSLELDSNTDKNMG
jgi:hypothetical protein